MCTYSRSAGSPCAALPRTGSAPPGCARTAARIPRTSAAPSPAPAPPSRTGPSRPGRAAAPAAPPPPPRPARPAAQPPGPPRRPGPPPAPALGRPRPRSRSRSRSAPSPWAAALPRRQRRGRLRRGPREGPARREGRSGAAIFGQAGVAVTGGALFPVSPGGNGKRCPLRGCVGVSLGSGDRGGVGNQARRWAAKRGGLSGAVAMATAGPEGRWARRGRGAGAAPPALEPLKGVGWVRCHRWEHPRLLSELGGGNRVSQPPQTSHE